ncbi:MAG: hypothetical protein CMJ78_09215 [Planctomycetaceae bacterium]|nr:hypothetical protein [Planctomycetaceae bacterium]
MRLYIEIRKLLSDDSIYVVPWACIALENTGKDAVNALPELKALLYDKREGRSMWAEAALSRLALTEQKAALILSDFEEEKERERSSGSL